MQAAIKPLNRFANQATQIGAFIGLWLVIDHIADAMHCSVPAGVLSLFVVLGLLLARVLPQRHIEAGARCLLAELPLFFIPPLLAVTESATVFAQYGLRLLAALVIGSMVVMFCTGLIVDRMFRFEVRLRAQSGVE